MELQATDRIRMLLWLRWDITFDWFGYTPALKRVHLALLVHRQPWSTRTLAEYTQLPQTTVRRHLAALEQGRNIDHVENGLQISDLGVALAASFHAELVKYIRGGCHINKDLIELMKKAPETGHMDFEKMETHVWWPVIDAPEIDDA